MPVKPTNLFSLALLYSLLFFFLFFQAPAVQAQTKPCSDQYLVEHAFENGSAWSMCWEWRPHEGIVLQDIYYKSPLGEFRKVLKEAAPAELHVTYDNGSVFYFDVSQEGLGTNMETLTAADCVGGLLLPHTIAEGDTRQVICLSAHSHGYAWKSLQNIGYSASLDLFSVSKIDAYEYVYRWSFHDDGSIDVQVGATGQLVEYGLGAEDYGWEIDPPVGEGLRPTIALSHIHTYWYRLDFDIDGKDNDIVEEFNFTSEDDGLRYKMEVTAFQQETARPVSPETARFWRIKDAEIRNEDGQSVSYRLEPTSQVIFRGRDEWAWAKNELYVTAWNPCENLLVAPTETADCGQNVTEYINGESVYGTDVVLWYGTSFHHLPRSEDEEFMPIHWEGFHIVPQDWTAQNEAIQAAQQIQPHDSPNAPIMIMNTPLHNHNGATELELLGFRMSLTELLLVTAFSTGSLLLLVQFALRRIRARKMKPN